VGDGSVTLLDIRAGSSSAVSGQPPFLGGARMWQLPAGYRVDLEAMRAGSDPVLARPAYVEPGPSSVAELGPFASATLDGDALGQRSLGDYSIAGLDSSASGWRDRELAIEPGSGSLPGTLVLTGLYEDSDYFENHFGGLTWFLAEHPETVVVGLDIGLGGSAASPSSLAADFGAYLLVLDARAASHVGAAPGDGWQTAALEGVALRVIDSDHPWDGM
jgi:hypothetical protein